MLHLTEQRSSTLVKDYRERARRSSSPPAPEKRVSRERCKPGPNGDIWILRTKGSATDIHQSCESLKKSGVYAWVTFILSASITFVINFHEIVPLIILYMLLSSLLSLQSIANIILLF